MMRWNFFFDGEAKPRIEVKFRELFLGSHPRVPPSARGVLAWAAFTATCRSRSRNRASFVVRGSKVQFYQINYSLEPASAGLTSFPATLGPEALQRRAPVLELLGRAGRDISSRTAPPGAQVQTATRTVTVPPKGTQSIFETSTGGRIVGLRFSPHRCAGGQNARADAAHRVRWRSARSALPARGLLWLRLGPARHENRFLVGTDGGVNYCYFPMPFARAALALNWYPSAIPPWNCGLRSCTPPWPQAANEGKFYALWRRENPTRDGVPFHPSWKPPDAGTLVGVVLQAQGFRAR